MSAKGRKNKNPYIREGTEMNIAQIAKKLNISEQDVNTALKGIFYKFRKHIKNNNIHKQDYL
jgi:DNA-binding CsgD family transcriptional regulator